MNIRKYLTSAAVLATVASLAIAIPAFAQTTNTPPAPGTNPAWSAGQQGGPGMGGMGMGRGRMGMKPGVFGTVSAVSGTTLTVSGKQGFGSTTTTTSFTVDASNATVMKNNATSSIASVAVGDTVMIRGTVSGTNVTATMIRDGVVPMRGGPGMGGMMGRGRIGSSTPPTSPITGNGEPVVAGTVTAVSGSSITITNKSNVAYTVDATNAKIVQGQTTISVSNINVGDSVIAQGTVNGNAVTATSIIDQGKLMTPGTGTPDSSSGTPAPHSFFGGIGQFFMHLFGF